MGVLLENPWQLPVFENCARGLAVSLVHRPLGYQTSGGLDLCAICFADRMHLRAATMRHAVGPRTSGIPGARVVCGPPVPVPSRVPQVQRLGLSLRSGVWGDTSCVDPASPPTCPVRRLRPCALCSFRPVPRTACPHPLTHDPGGAGSHLSRLHSVTPCQGRILRFPRWAVPGGSALASLPSQGGGSRSFMGLTLERKTMVVCPPLCWSIWSKSASPDQPANAGKPPDTPQLGEVGIEQEGLEKEDPVSR
jgi:hypothetical protein